MPRLNGRSGRKYGVLGLKHGDFYSNVVQMNIYVGDILINPNWLGALPFCGASFSCSYLQLFVLFVTIFLSLLFPMVAACCLLLLLFC